MFLTIHIGPQSLLVMRGPAVISPLGVTDERHG
jgi:hypothetical protein